MPPPSNDPAGPRPRLALWLLALVLCVAGSGAWVLVSAEQLPAVVASHFGADNRADGFMPHDGYRRFMLAFSVGFPLFLALMTGGLPRLIPQWINIPHRAYWLAPERRAATIDLLSAFGCALGCWAALLSAGVQLAVVRAHRVDPPVLPLDIFLPLLLGFLTAMALGIVWLYRRFRLPP
jgi:hypothetical protein